MTIWGNLDEMARVCMGIDWGPAYGWGWGGLGAGGSMRWKSSYGVLTLLLSNYKGGEGT